MKKCLLICPLSFYGWQAPISKELRRRGYNVELSNDEYPNNILGLLIGNYFNFLSRKLTYIKLKKKLKKDKHHYDLILIFKGRGISSELIDLFSSYSNKVVAYNFDSFKYFPFALNWFHKIENYKTFDFLDSNEKSIEQVDLFSDYEPSKNIIKSIDFSCVMKNHSDRLLYLDEVYSSLSNKYSFKIHIYEKNVLTYIKGFIRNPRLFIKWRKFISFKSLSSHDYFKILESSKFTIDYAHPSQTGITMRCFQAMACKTGVISNNPNLSLSKTTIPNFYVHKLGGSKERLISHVRNNIFKSFASHIRNVEAFLDDLLVD